MPRYRYTAYDSRGKPVSGEVDGTSEASAVQSLRKEGLVPVEVRLRAEKVRMRERDVKPVSLEDHLLFCRSLASYLRGGLTLSHVLVLLAKQSPSVDLRTLYTRLKTEVESGKSLGTGMRESGRFREDLVGMVESGERSGSLPQILDRASRLYRLEIGLRRRVRSALTYPLVMMAVGMAVVAFLLAYVVPKLSALFADMGESLPMPTRILLWMSSALEIAGIPLLVGVLVLFLWLRRKGSLFSKLPLKSLRERITLSLVFSHLSTLLDCGIPLVQALSMIAPMDPEPSRWESVSGRIRKGYRLGQALQDEGSFAEDAVYIVQVGEAGGELSEALQQVADNSWEIAENRMARLADLVEPAMVLVLGAVVGFVVIAILLPIFDLSSLIR
jgi:type II secretory pathway component PulF